MNDSHRPARTDPARLLALRESGLLDTPADPSFDRWTRLIRTLLSADISLITLLDRDRQFFKSAAGLGEPWASRRETPLSHSFCQYVVERNEALVVSDARTEPDLSENKAIEEMGVIAYLGVPLRSWDGQLLGSLSAISTSPREWTAGEVGIVRDLAAAVTNEIELKALGDAAREQLRDREQWFRTLIERTFEVIAVLDARGRITYQSPSIERLLGTPADAQVGKSALHRLHPRDADRAKAAFRNAVARPERIVEEELRFRHADGSWRTLEVVGRSFLHDPAVGGVVLNLRDVTERRELQAQLLQAQKMEAIGRLAGGIAHDFNNLLTAIGGTADLAMEDLPPGAPGREDLEEIRHAAGRAGELTRQLLAFSRQQVLHPRPVDLNGIVRSSERLLRRIIGEDVELMVGLEEQPCTVEVDPVQIEQVILNLAVNARDAMPDGGRLTIRTRLEPSGADPDREGLSAGQVALEVSDTGHGMDEATRARAFDPFFTTKRVGKGTGLGLSTVYGIVQQSGGTIEMDSAPGEGTRITVRLQRSSAEPGAEDPPKDLVDDESAAGAVILLAEDEAAVRRLAERVLSRAGYTVLTAADGVEALEVAAGHQGAIDLLVSDMVMPEMTGVELAERLRAARPDMAVIFVSGYTAETSGQLSEMAQSEHFMEKPFTPAALTALVRQVLTDD